MKRTTEINISVDRLIRIVSEKYGIDLSEAHAHIEMVQDPKGDIRDNNEMPILKSITFKHVEELKT